MISEVDIQDWERGPLTELYNVPNNTYVEEPETGWIVKFHNIDGMYSYCHDLAGNVCHIKAWTKVYPLKEKNEKV